MRTSILAATLAAAFVFFAMAPAADAKSKAHKAHKHQEAAQAEEHGGGVRWADRIVAIVNDDLITEKDVRDVMNSVKSANKDMSNAQAWDAALDDLINQKLILQVAKRKNIEISDMEIDAAIREIAQNRKMSVDELIAAIKKEGVTKDMLRKTVANGILTQMVTKQALSSMTRVSDSDVANFLASHELQGERKEYLASHILLKTDGTRTNEEILKTLNIIKKQARAGAQFAQLAKRYSQDLASASNGGDLGWVREGVTVPEFEDALVKLQPGQISGPVRTPFGWHLIELRDERSYVPTQDQAMLLARRYLEKQKYKSVYSTWMKSLRKSAYIEIKERPY